MTGSSVTTAVDAIDLWYHTIEVAPGVTTPGWFDLRPVVGRLPWPGLVGARCLDVGTWDGYLAFEMERRGADEVIATDIRDHEDWDWLPRERADGPTALAAMSGRKGAGFEVARQLLDSSVERTWIDVYDLSPERVGTFDVVVVGALLLHLRDPFGALEAVRSVCAGTLLSVEQIDLRGTVLHPRRPHTFIEGRHGRWMMPNAAGHRRMLEIAGFTAEDQVLLAEPFGPAHPTRQRGRSSTLRDRLRRAVQRRVVGGEGLPTSAVRAVPA